MGKTATATPATKKTAKGKTAKALDIEVKGVGLAIAKPADGDDLLAELSGTATDATTVKSGGKEDRTLIPLKGEVGDLLDRHCQAKAWMDRVKGLAEGSRADLEPLLTNQVCGLMIKERGRVTNPHFATESSKLLLQVKNTISLKMPLVEEGKKVTVADRFSEAGVPKERAAQLGELFTMKQDLTLQSITDMNSKEATKAIASKIMRSIKGLSADEVGQVREAMAGHPLLAQVLEMISGLSANERKDALRVTTSVAPIASAENTINKMATICKNSQELATALDVAGVQIALSQVTYSGDLMEAGKTLLDFKPTQINEYFTPDKSYRAVVKGNKAILYHGDQTMIEKTCDDEGHSRFTCKKWATNPQYLADSIAKSIKG